MAGKPKLWNWSSGRFLSAAAVQMLSGEVELPLLADTWSYRQCWRAMWLHSWRA